MGGKIRYMILFSVLLFLMPLCVAQESLKASLDTPSWTFRSTEAEPLVLGDSVEGYVKVANRNDFPITVEMDPAEGLQIFFSDGMSSLLEAGEENSFPYAITLNTLGTSSSSIAVRYSTDEANVSPDSFVLYAKVTFVEVVESAPEPGPGPEPEQQTQASSGGGSSGGGGGGGVAPKPEEEASEPETVELPVDEPEPEATEASGSEQAETDPNQEPLPITGMAIDGTEFEQVYVDRPKGLLYLSAWFMVLAIAWMLLALARKGSRQFN